ncbi:hypothetical protein VNO78_10010 [Psophocarpus tetragonolobus]|uniref:Uncharacterized protein n=1 Tax=Psophocarpus tetragonolobus TaxID=3891 RepID=A0AAN9SKH1_PSOTE
MFWVLLCVSRERPFPGSDQRELVSQTVPLVGGFPQKSTIAKTNKTKSQILEFAMQVKHKLTNDESQIFRSVPVAGGQFI